ncbi:MAG TPA: hypothetical protein VM755_01420 [Stellaceae bacterium]|nr:hypothetical protein [Stellaceae bacterium]
MTNVGTIEALGSLGSNYAVVLDSGGSVDNKAATGIINGYEAGVVVKGAARGVTNAGTIGASGTQGVGIYLGSGGHVTNTGANATIVVTMPASSCAALRER